MIKYLVGNAALPEGDKCLIVHVCNNLGGFGKGFAWEIARRYPMAKAKYVQKHRLYGLRLGEVILSPSGYKNIAVANMVAQNGYKTFNNPRPLDYPALVECLTEVARYCKTVSGITVHMPKIGTGLAGGSWGAVSGIINSTLCAEDIPVFVYVLNA